jgi:hypothetical protein
MSRVVWGIACLGMVLSALPVFAGAKEDCRIVFQQELGAQVAYVRNTNAGRSVTVTVATTACRGATSTRLPDQVFNLSPGQQGRLGGTSFNGTTYVYQVVGANYR